MPYFRKRRRLEIVGWLTAFVAMVALAISVDAHEALDALFASHEATEIDEVFTALMIAGALGLAYSLFRYKDLSDEVRRRYAAEEKVERAILHDCLTGLPNRRMLDAEVVSLSKVQAATERYAAFSIDLDGLKRVNADLGQRYGDTVLITIADRLARLQPDDQVFHLGGDRFLILAPGTSFSAAQAHARRIMRAIGQPMRVEGAAIELGLSLGYAVFPDDAGDLRTLVHAAECAMYVAKKCGRNVTQAFTPAMAKEVQGRLKMEADLKSAIQSNAIVPYYQPLVDLKTGEIVGYEALARWAVYPGTFVSPGEFIPLAEECGLISALTDCLFAQACRDAMGWPAATTLSFNISALQLGDRLLGLKIIKTLAETGFPAHRLQLEVTESAIIQDAESAHYVLESLDAAGIRIALDDFGTGHSSLSQLSNYPFHTIKIDRSFVASFETSEKQEKIVRSIVALGKSLGVKITAEGIECDSQLRKLEALGCDIGQGYLLGRPVPGAALAVGRTARSMVGQR